MNRAFLTACALADCAQPAEGAWDPVTVEPFDEEGGSGTVYLDLYVQVMSAAIDQQRAARVGSSAWGTLAYALQKPSRLAL